MKPVHLLYFALAASTILLAWALLGNKPDDLHVCPPERRVDNFCKTTLPGGVIWLRQIPGAGIDQ